MTPYFTKIMITIIGIVLLINTGNSQTLSIGDIAIIGFHTDANDGFTFIALTDIPENEEIYFTEKGWRYSPDGWYTVTEGHILWTAPVGGVACGTITNIEETVANTYTLTGSGSVVHVQGTWNLFGGDQVIAYQSSTGVEPASPSFLAAIHGDYNSGDYDVVTTWNNGASSNNTGTSRVPTGLTNGVNCISLFPAPGPERDNARYTGSLVGTAAAIRAAIHNTGNWTTSDSPLGINLSDYGTPTIDCTLLPIEMVSFEVYPVDGRQANILWSTASEINNDFFTIEKSKDDQNWHEVAIVNSSGNAVAVNTYQFIDKKPHLGLSYYRLKQTDFDGQYSFSKVKSLKLDDPKNVQVFIYPNPMTNEMNIQGSSLELNEFQIFNILGQEVSGMVRIIENADSYKRIDVKNLNTGFYIIKTRTITSKVYKK